MRKIGLILLLTAVVGFTAADALAVGASWVPTRDTGSNANSGEQLNNRGASTNIRACKGPGGETWYGDFDTDAIAAWKAANPKYPAQQYIAKLNVMCSFGPGWTLGGIFEVRTLNLLYDWAEGTGSSLFTQWNWADPANNPAATDLYAQTYAVGTPYAVDTTRSIAWYNEAGTLYTRYYANTALHKYLNTATYTGTGVELNTYFGWQLDDTVMNDLLTNPLNRGLALWSSDWGLNQCYTANAADTQKPYLSVNIWPITADLDKNNVVEFTDYQYLEAYFGNTGVTWDMGDINGDGIVDFTDYQILEMSFGDTYAPVPEPTTLGLLALGLVLSRRRR